MNMFSLFARGTSTKRGSLRALLDMDEVRLTDLGLTRLDVLEAMRHGNRAGSQLSARRAARAGSLAR